MLLFVCFWFEWGEKMHRVAHIKTIRCEWASELCGCYWMSEIYLHCDTASNKIDSIAIEMHLLLIFVYILYIESICSDSLEHWMWKIANQRWQDAGCTNHTHTKIRARATVCQVNITSTWMSWVDISLVI